MAKVYPVWNGKAPNRSISGLFSMRERTLARAQSIRERTPDGPSVEELGEGA